MNYQDQLSRGNHRRHQRAIDVQDCFPIPTQIRNHYATLLDLYLTNGTSDDISWVYSEMERIGLAWFHYDPQGDSQWRIL